MSLLLFGFDRWWVGSFIRLDLGLIYLLLFGVICGWPVGWFSLRVFGWFCGVVCG